MPQSTQTAKIQSIGRLDDGRWRIILQPDAFSFGILQSRQLSYGNVATSSVTLDPYVNTANFINSDFNAVIGNATDIREGTLYQDIDYSSNATTPVNLNQLLLGSATKANVPDSNYSTKRITTPRYEGSRSSTALDTTFNSPTVEGGLGVLPNVEQDRAYFAYFNWVGGTAPEWGNGLADRSALSVRYFIDGDGNVIEPTNDSNGVNLSIAEQTFTEGETAVLSFDDQTGASANFANLPGDQVIFKSGKTITPIIYSQTQSISDTTPGGFTGSLYFTQGDQTQGTLLDDYRLTAFVVSNSQFLQYDNTDVKFNFQQYLGDSGSFASKTTYSNNSSGATDNPGPLGITLTYKAALKPDQYSGVNNANAAVVTFQFQKDGIYVGNSVQVDWAQPNTTAFLSYSDSNIASNNSVKLVAKTVALAGGNAATLPVLDNDSFFKVIQSPPPTLSAIGPGNPGPNSNYWSKGGIANQPGSERIQPLSLGTAYGQKQQNIEADVDGNPVGFFPIVNDFTLQVGDEFRFQGTETQTYKIIEVDNTFTPPIFVVDRYVNITNTEMNWFLVRRYVDNPSNIILEVDKPAGGTSPGFLMPLYATKGIEDNFDEVIQKLKTEQLI